MKRRGKFNSAFAASFNRNQDATNNFATGVPYGLLKSARHSGQLNLSGQSLETVPLNVWRINLDVPEEAKGATLANDNERWWDQVDLRKLILASNQLTVIPDEVKFVPALHVLDAHDNNISIISGELKELKELSKLHLSHNNLSKLPDAFCKVVSLKILLLAGNGLVSLPDDFGSLSTLEELDLSVNKLIDLPQSFGQLKNLKKANLSKNEIKCLPSAFENLSSLLDLNLSSNKLGTLPQGFDCLNSLEILDCNYNQIMSFTTFSKPANIKQLFLGNNRIQKMEEDAFEMLPYLVSLNMRDNAISKIPDSFTKLTHLERADFSNNSLTGLPYVIGNMKLKVLTLDGNPFRSIRRDLLTLGTQALLDHLKMKMPVAEATDGPAKVQLVENIGGKKPSCRNDNSIKEPNTVIEPKQEVVDQYLIATTKVLSHSGGKLPAGFWLPGAQITKITLTRNSLVSFPEEIVNYAETMSELDVSKNNLTSIPPDVAKLRKLAFLNFSNNSLTMLPAELGNLEHLMEVNLSFNKFTVIPDCLFDAKKLQTILLANNQITDINVDGLMRLKTLHVLDLSNNNIARVPPQLGNVEWLKSLTLDGNAFRNPRPQMLMKGTQFLLEYLRDRIPT